ncbi:MAG: L,D-transpeptidase family protein [Pseudomonadota bacterium]
MPEKTIYISIAGQCLQLLEDGEVVCEFPVSTAANGPGEEKGSNCTPRGRHVVRAKIGKGCPPDTVFIGRRPTGEIYSPSLRTAFPGRDWILTRILWLSGLEPGRNRLGNVDTMRRYIYIHGSPDDVAMGVPGSHGCVRMRNSDIIELFDQVEAGTKVLIEE